MYCMSNAGHHRTVKIQDVFATLAMRYAEKREKQFGTQFGCKNLRLQSDDDYSYRLKRVTHGPLTAVIDVHKVAEA